MTTREDMKIELAFMLYKGLVKNGADPKSQAFRDIINNFVERVDQITKKETK